VPLKNIDSDNPQSGAVVLRLKGEDGMFVLPSSDNYQPSINQVPRLNSPMCIDGLAI